MKAFARAAVIGLLLGLALPIPASAIDSRSASFSNTRSSVDSGGLRKFSAGYRLDASQGTITSPLGASASYRNRDGFMGVAFQPSRVTDLWASSTTQTTEIYLQWTAPGNDGDDDTIPGKFIIKYSSVAASSPAGSDANFNAADAIPVAAPVPGQRGTQHTLTIPGLVAGVTYYFAIKTAERDGVRSVLSAGATAQVALSSITVLNVPQAPFGLALSSAGATVDLTWMPVQRFATGVLFANPYAATAPELTGYRVYRSTSLVQGSWTEMAALSSATLVWTDGAGGPQYFYAVRAENTAGFSARSLLRAVGSLSAYAVAPDDRSYLEATIPSLSPIEGVGGVPMTAYLVEAQNRNEYLGGRVVRSVEFTAKQGGAALSNNFELPTMGRMKLHYELSGSSVIASGLDSGLQAVPENLGVYWFNGTKWVQMYGTLDKTDQTMNVQTKYLGQYELRVVERTASFSFDAAGVSNRFVTPNGDGRNDNVVFTYDNPRDSSVRIRILDLRGQVVMSDLPQGPISNSRIWNGVAGGRAVPGGVYIYQIEAEGRVVSGTLVILK